MYSSIKHIDMTHCPIRHHVYMWYLMALIVHLFMLNISNNPIVWTHFGLPRCENVLGLDLSCFSISCFAFLALFSSLIHNFWKRATGRLNQYAFITTADPMAYCTKSKSLIMSHWLFILMQQPVEMELILTISFGRLSSYVTASV